MFEHRWVMEQVIGRPLRRNEIVHHINHNRQDNDPDNLAIVTRAQHKKLHPNILAAWAYHYDRCIDCGTTDRAHEANGRCSACDMRWRRAKRKSA